MDNCYGVSKGTNFFSGVLFTERENVKKRAVPLGKVVNIHLSVYERVYCDHFNLISLTGILRVNVTAGNISAVDQWYVW